MPPIVLNLLVGLIQLVLWSTLMLIIIYSQGLSARFDEDNESFEMKYAWPFRVSPYLALFMSVFFLVGAFQKADPATALICSGFSVVLGVFAAFCWLYYSSTRLVVTLDSLTWYSWFWDTNEDLLG